MTAHEISNNILKLLTLKNCAIYSDNLYLNPIAIRLFPLFLPFIVTILFIHLKINIYILKFVEIVIIIKIIEVFLFDTIICGQEQEPVD